MVDRTALFVLYCNCPCLLLCFICCIVLYRLCAFHGNLRKHVRVRSDVSRCVWMNEFKATILALCTVFANQYSPHLYICICFSAKKKNFSSTQEVAGRGHVPPPRSSSHYCSVLIFYNKYISIEITTVLEGIIIIFNLNDEGQKTPIPSLWNKSSGKVWTASNACHLCNEIHNKIITITYDLISHTQY